MKKLVKLFLLSSVLLSDFITFAQEDPDSGGPVEGTDPAAAPINSKLILLALAGVCFVFYYFRKNKKIGNYSGSILKET